MIWSAAEYQQPETGIHLLGLLIYTLPATLAALGTLWAVVYGQRKGIARWRRDRALIKDIHHQNVNSHADGPNMRDQIDDIQATQKSALSRQEDMAQYLSEVRRRQTEQARDISGIRADIGGLRGEQRDTARELTEHRRETREFEDRVTGFAREQHPDADPP